MAIINEGELLLEGNPSDTLRGIEGKIWKRSIPKNELESYKEKYQVISERMIAGNPEIHVYSETIPDPGFEPVTADLEDVYFAHILGLEKAAATL